MLNEEAFAAALAANEAEDPPFPLSGQAGLLLLALLGEGEAGAGLDDVYVDIDDVCPERLAAAKTRVAEALGVDAGIVEAGWQQVREMSPEDLN